MALELKQAQRKKAFLKLGISAPSGGGKTLGALLIAYGLMKKKYPKASDEERWSKIAIIDTENGSGELYVGKDIAGIVIGTYNAITLRPPFEADKYTNAINLCKDAGMEVCIIDSSTHLWSGEGGLLEQQGSATKRTGNSWTAWRDITPQHNRFVDTMLQSPMHIIATMRAKQEYVQDKDANGKTTVRKLGMEPEQRKGMEYEFTTFFEITADHEAFGAKDRTSMFDQRSFRITPKTGEEMMEWLEGGTSATSVVVATEQHKVDKPTAVASVKSELVELIRSLGGSKNEILMTILKSYVPSGNINALSDEAQLGNLRAELLDLQAQQSVGTSAVETN